MFNGDRTSIYVIKSLNTELKHIVINFPYYLQYYIYLYELYYNMLYHQTNGENNRIRLSEDLLIECISIFGNNIEVFSINIYLIVKIDNDNGNLLELYYRYYTALLLLLTNSNKILKNFVYKYNIIRIV